MGTTFEDARLALARLRIDEARLESEVFHHAVKISARALGVERVGVWTLMDADQRLECALLYQKAGDKYEVGTEIPRCDAASYFAALSQRRVIATEDALVDPVTSCLAERYLVPRGIGAMLDAPIYLEGKVFGVVCHEHVGGKRIWNQFEIDFASTFADVISSLYLQRRLREQERRVRESAMRLQDAGKLAGLTHVTRAFAHDLNNALTVATLTAARLESIGSAELTEMGLELGRSAEFAVRVVRDLQAFATRDGSDIASIGAVIETFRPVLGALLRGAVELVIRIDDPDATPTASRTQIEQLLMNLCVNARDASLHGGTVTVHAHLDSARTMLVLQVEDEGVGIAPELLPQIFDVYVTTKPQGSGLGLAIVRGIVDEHGGRIDVSSVVGQGTRFTVALPLRR
jgi:signal transduction histidine kinase